MSEGCQPCAERQAALSSWVQSHGAALVAVLVGLAVFALWPHIAN